MRALGRRYARALHQLASERGQADAVGRDLNDFRSTWEASRELRQVFDNPSFGQESRHEVLDAIAKRTGMSPTLRHTLCLLSDRRRMRIVADLADAYRSLAEERDGRVRAEVTTASVMPETYYAELRRALEGVTGKKVVLVKRQDEALIGGVVARVGDKVFDGSLRSRLAELEDELTDR